MIRNLGGNLPPPAPEPVREAGEAEKAEKAEKVTEA
jgi:hypothetical protein